MIVVNDDDDDDDDDDDCNMTAGTLMWIVINIRYITPSSLSSSS